MYWPLRQRKTRLALFLERSLFDETGREEGREWGASSCTEDDLTYMCLFRLDDWLKALPHAAQTWGLYFSWTCKMWIRRRSRFSKDLKWRITVEVTHSNTRFVREPNTVCVCVHWSWPANAKPTAKWSSFRFRTPKNGSHGGRLVILTLFLDKVDLPVANWTGVSAIAHIDAAGEFEVFVQVVLVRKHFSTSFARKTIAHQLQAWHKNPWQTWKNSRNCTTVVP